MASFVLAPIESAEDEEAAQTRAALSEQWESGLAPDPLFCFHNISDSQRHWSQDDLPTGPLLCGTHKVLSTMLGEDHQGIMPARNALQKL